MAHKLEQTINSSVGCHDWFIVACLSGWKDTPKPDDFFKCLNHETFKEIEMQIEH